MSILSSFSVSFKIDGFTIVKIVDAGGTPVNLFLIRHALCSFLSSTIPKTLSVIKHYYKKCYSRIFHNTNKYLYTPEELQE